MVSVSHSKNLVLRTSLPMGKQSSPTATQPSMIQLPHPGTEKMVPSIVILLGSA